MSWKRSRFTNALTRQATPKPKFDGLLRKQMARRQRDVKKNTTLPTIRISHVNTDS
jgi:hypothetical protein